MKIRTLAFGLMTAGVATGMLAAQEGSESTDPRAVPGSMQASAPSPDRPLLGDGPVMRIPIEGVIELGLAPFVERSLREAASMGAAAVILDIETPGGRVDAAERIVDAVSDSEVPVFAYVNRRAISAGAMISLAAAEIFMRPGATLGASTPVDGTGEKAPEKIVSVMRSSHALARRGPRSRPRRGRGDGRRGDRGRGNRRGGPTPDAHLLGCGRGSGTPPSSRTGMR
jgi:membrane-bound ClpP family serine protease